MIFNSAILKDKLMLAGQGAEDLYFKPIVHSHMPKRKAARGPHVDGVVGLH